jgi:hypothetical protein
MNKQIVFSWDTEDRPRPEGDDEYDTYQAVVLKVNEREIWASSPSIYIDHDEDAEEAAVNALVESFHAAARSTQL